MFFIYNTIIRLLVQIVKGGLKTGSLTLTDQATGVWANLTVVKIGYEISPTEHRVFGSKSAWTSVPTIDVSTVNVTYQPPTNMEFPMVCTEGFNLVELLQHWAEKEVILLLEGEEVNIINWQGVITEATYQWNYADPAPTGELKIQTGVNWLYDYSAGTMSPAELNDLWSAGLVTKTATQIEKEAEKKDPGYFHGAGLVAFPPYMEQVNKILEKGESTEIKRNADGSLNIVWKGKRLYHVRPSDALFRNLLSN